MCDGMTVAAMGMVNGKADVIMAGISRGRLRRGNTDTLERKGQSGRHHQDNSKPSEKRLSREPQRSGSLDNKSGLYRRGVRQDKGLPDRDTCRGGFQTRPGVTEREVKHLPYHASGVCRERAGLKSDGAMLETLV